MFKIYNVNTKIFVCVVLMLSAAGCATVGTKRDYIIGGFPEKGRPGVYHKVKKGDTLWRISKAYDVAIDEIIESNRIPNVARIEENQLVFVPGVHSTKEITASKEDRENSFIWPIRGKLIGYFHERKGDYFNKGIDIQAQEGAVIRAAHGGRVVFADYLTGYGYTVVLDHMGELYSVYARNDRLSVRLNDSVRQGQEIARLGRIDSTPYLHFEIRKRALEHNPLYYLP